MSQYLRLLAEHEAAHAVVARHYGMTVHRIRIGQRAGYTEWTGDAQPWQAAAIKAAGDVFNREQSSVPYQDLACRDLAEFERDYGLDRLYDANRAARTVLTQRRRAVLTLADRLVRERTITLV